MSRAGQLQTQADSEAVGSKADGCWLSRRQKAAQESAAANYRILLNEVVKDPESQWLDARPRLERDPQVCLWS